MGDKSGLIELYGPKIGRKYTKNVGFGCGYGMQIDKMMRTYGWDKEEATRIWNAYHTAAPFVQKTMDACKIVIIQKGYVTLLSGRRAHLPKGRNGKPLTDYAYTAYNKLIQGSGADEIKMAVIKMDEAGLLEEFPLYFLVHDELVFGVKAGQAPEYYDQLDEVQYCMEHAYELKVPMRVDIKIGHDWYNVEGQKIYKNGRKETLRHLGQRMEKEAA